MNKDPFESSVALSKWASDVLIQRGIEEIAQWRMLEYWMQVELFRSVMKGNAGLWKYLGEYEQPYYTDMPKSGAKHNIKWVDMVLAEPSLESPHRIVWIELKDIGRSKHTFETNLKGLGQDLATLYRLRPARTKEIWLNPPAHVVDKGRQPEWDRYASSLGFARHFIAQVVIIPLSVLPSEEKNTVRDIWLRSFENRAKIDSSSHDIQIKRTDGGGFATFALVAGVNP